MEHSIQSLEPIQLATHRRLTASILGLDCHVTAIVTEYFDLITGDGAEFVTVNEIITANEGQMILPRTLSVDDFRSLCKTIKAAPVITL